LIAKKQDIANQQKEDIAKYSKKGRYIALYSKPTKNTCKTLETYPSASPGMSSHPDSMMPTRGVKIPIWNGENYPKMLRMLMVKSPILLVNSSTIHPNNGLEHSIPPHYPHYILNTHQHTLTISQTSSARPCVSSIIKFRMLLDPQSKTNSTQLMMGATSTP
jgi:hypothetical protein